MPFPHSYSLSSALPDSFSPFSPCVLLRASKPASLPIWTRPIPMPSRSIIMHHLSNALLLSMRACNPPGMPLLDLRWLSQSRISMEALTCSSFLYMTKTSASKCLCEHESSFQRSRVGNTVSGACQCSSSRLWSELQESTAYVQNILVDHFIVSPANIAAERS